MNDRRVRPSLAYGTLPWPPRMSHVSDDRPSLLARFALTLPAGRATECPDHFQCSTFAIGIGGLRNVRCSRERFLARKETRRRDERTKPDKADSDEKRHIMQAKNRHKRGFPSCARFVISRTKKIIRHSFASVIIGRISRE